MRTVAESAILVVVFLAACAASAQAEFLPRKDADSPAARYFADFRKRLESARRDIPHISQIAEQVADKFIDKEVIYLAPNQDSFLFELWGRASGLTAAQKWAPENMKLQDDVLLLAIEPTTDYPDRGPQWVNTAYQSPATIIAFSSPEDLKQIAKEGSGHFEAGDFYAVIDNHTSGNQFEFVVPSGTGPKTVHMSGMVNMLNGWLFVGELAAACTRRGKMPVFWLSYAVDKRQGYARAAAHSKTIPEGKQWGPSKAFHDDLVVPPIKAGVVANQYLDHLEWHLDALEGPSRPYMDRAAEQAVATIRDGKEVYALLIGHAFPWDVPKSEWNGTITILRTMWKSQMEPVEKEGGEGDLFILLCMPTYEAEYVQRAKEKGMNIVVMSTEPPDVSDANAEGFLWIPARWPIEDGAVELPGYDIRILPVTGIMNGVIFHALRSEVQYRLAREPAGGSP